VVDSVTRPPTAQRLELRPATTAVGKVTSPGIAQQTPKPKPAISVVKRVIFRVNARKPPHPHRVEVEVEAEVVKNATNAGKSVTSLVPAPTPPALEVPTVVVVAVVVTAEATALLGVGVVVVVPKPATLAVVSDTFLATVYKVPSVTTVLASVTLAGTAPSPRSALAITVVLKDTSPVTVPTPPQRHEDSVCSSCTLLVPYLFSMISCA